MIKQSKKALWARYASWGFPHHNESWSFCVCFCDVQCFRLHSKWGKYMQNMGANINQWWGLILSAITPNLRIKRDGKREWRMRWGTKKRWSLCHWKLEPYYDSCAIHSLVVLMLSHTEPLIVLFLFIYLGRRKKTLWRWKLNNCCWWPNINVL